LILYNTAIRNIEYFIYTCGINTAIRKFDMSEYKLGHFEEIVLLTVCVLYENAYGISIKDEIENRMKKRISVGALQSALRRMEEKGYLKSKEGEETNERGGRRKRYFTITQHGKNALHETRDLRSELWEAIPGVVFSQIEI
jgi:DNA-binding PadR family transcriptional regulator